MSPAPRGQVLRMAERKSFLLRIEREVLRGIERWAAEDLRSVNAQIEFLLRRALSSKGRVGPPTAGAADATTGKQTRSGPAHR